MFRFFKISFHIIQFLYLKKRIFIVYLGVKWAPEILIFIVLLILNEHGIPKTIFSKWVKWTNEQMIKMNKWANISTYLRKWANTFITKLAKWANEQNAHISKFGVKWAPEVLNYYKNTSGCTMLMVHPGVLWVNSLKRCLILFLFCFKCNK